MPSNRAGRKLPGVQAGAAEPIFGHLPQRVLHDLSHRRSESALLWNSFYLRATPRIALGDLLALPRLWGSHSPEIADSLAPFYWGFNLSGERLPELDSALAEIDGPGAGTEVDLFLLGDSELVLIEAKAGAGLGRCSRYGAERCPEIHGTGEQYSGGLLYLGDGALSEDDPSLQDRHAPEPCRYWEPGPARFSDLLELGLRPTPESAAPPCDRHYQLSRSLLLGQRLAERLGRSLHLWLLLPERRWPRLQRDWLDFVERVRSTELWRRLRVLSWEAFRSLPT